MLGLIRSSFAEMPKTIIINSDYSVKKYQTVQDEFEKTFSYPVSKIDLGDPQWGYSKVKSYLTSEPHGLIYCIGTEALLLTRKYNKNERILFSSVVNWLRFPVDENSYGISNEIHVGMQLAMFQYFFQKIKKIGIAYSEKYNAEWFKLASIEAEKRGIQLIGQTITKKLELTELLPQIEALWIIPEPMIISKKDYLFEILETCEKSNIPIFSYLPDLSECGAVLIITVDDPTIGRQSADIAMQILEEKPIQDKIQSLVGSHVIFNLKKANSYQLKFNKDALDAADVILK
ncbi:MAG: hypothetical protein HQK77_01220 [Desulfobacterales bacterium]|nr:hypothetical protein [Desulfobacterales bacterium]